MKKLIIFDLDGTLLYTLEDIKICINAILKKYGYKEISIEEVRQFVGNGAKKLVERALKKENVFNFEKICFDYINLQKECKNENTILYSGLDYVLKELKRKGYLLAIVSNKPDDVTKEVYKNKLAQYNFDFVLGQKEDFLPKPDKSCIEFVLNKLNLKKSNAIYIGDSEVDVQTFINSGIDGIGVLWGFRDKSVLEKYGCLNIVSNGEELLNKIYSM